jgi:hypothetical protein
MSAIYGTGYNTYYWYDMVTEIPNAYFVQAEQHTGFFVMNLKGPSHQIRFA